MSSSRLVAALRPSDASLKLLGVVSALTAIVFIAVTWPFTWTSDITRNLAAAQALLDGRFGTVDGYLYSPFAAALTIPLLALPSAAAIVLWLVAKIGLLVAGVRAATVGVDGGRRLLLAIAVLGFLPVVHDLLLGNVTVALAAVIAVVAWTRDRALTGIPLGIVLAAVPKPALIPVLAWMLVRRPRALATSLVVAAITSVATLLVVGAGPYTAWLAALRNPPILSGGNFALSAWPPLVAGLAMAATLAATAVAMWRGDGPGLVCALGCGLLVSNYTVLYGAGILLVGVPLLARAAPRATMALALIAPVALLGAFPLWVGAVMTVALLAPARAWPDTKRHLTDEGSQRASQSASAGTARVDQDAATVDQ